MNDLRTTTQSLCPVCLSRVSAQRVVEGPDVYLTKTCPDHGCFRTLIWEGDPPMATWERPKVPAPPPVAGQAVTHGCPFDCGLCPDHRQRTCTVLIEVTGRCDLRCPVCYADAGVAPGPDPPLSTLRRWLERAGAAAAGSNIQLSGGEPTVRDDLPEIIAMTRSAGFAFVQLNTNGIRLGRDPGYAASLKEAGLASVFLQFDATDDDGYHQLRGRPLLAEKTAAIEACRESGLGVVLVPTVVPGINDDQIGAIIQTAITHSPTVRAVHFQPLSFFGRYPEPPDGRRRPTLPWLMREIEAQTDGRFPVDAFSPPGCENALCSFSGSFLPVPGNGVRPLGRRANPGCCPEPIPAHDGAARTIAHVARRWAAPEVSVAEAGSSGCTPSGILWLDDFLNRAQTHTLSVSAMAFQDAWTVDLERVRDCCIHVLAPDGRLIPFCLYNLTSAGGDRLYRP